LATVADLVGNKKWAEADAVSELSFTFCTYNQESFMFASTTVAVVFEDYGSLKLDIFSKAASSHPYQQWMTYPTGILFTLFILWLLKGEGGDMCGKLRISFGEFLDYWQFWNCVDWFSIIMGLIQIILWVVMVIYMYDDKINHFLNDDKYIKKDLMTLSNSEVQDAEEVINTLNSLYRTFEWVSAINVISIIMKFFKGFTSNERLMVVPKTVAATSLDMIHFFINFFFQFLPFALILHIMFGADCAEGSSLVSSLNCCFYTLMGEYGWYIDFTFDGTVDFTTGFTDTLTSGMHVWILYIWFVVYEVLIFIVMMNVLMAIIMEHYMFTNAKVKKYLAKGNDPTLVRQAKDYYHYRRATSSFIPLENILGDIENDDNQGHWEPWASELMEEKTKEATEETEAKWPPPDMVEATEEEKQEWMKEQIEMLTTAKINDAIMISQESLIQWWPKMSEAQAQWIMAYLEKMAPIYQDQDRKDVIFNEWKKTGKEPEEPDEGHICVQEAKDKLIGVTQSTSDQIDALSAALTTKFGANTDKAKEEQQKQLEDFSLLMEELVTSLKKMAKTQEDVSTDIEALKADLKAHRQKAGLGAQEPTAVQKTVSRVKLKLKATVMLNRASKQPNLTPTSHSSPASPEQLAELTTGSIPLGPVSTEQEPIAVTPTSPH